MQFFGLRLKGYLKYTHPGEFPPTSPLYTFEVYLLLLLNALNDILYHIVQTECIVVKHESNLVSTDE